MMVAKLLTKKKTFINCHVRINGNMRVTYDHIYAQQYNREIDDFEDILRSHVNNYA